MKIEAGAGPAGPAKENLCLPEPAPQTRTPPSGGFSLNLPGQNRRGAGGRGRVSPREAVPRAERVVEVDPLSPQPATFAADQGRLRHLRRPQGVAKVHGSVPSCREGLMTDADFAASGTASPADGALA